MSLVKQYRDVVSKVCYLYSSPTAPFEDLYQEVLINLWQGLETFRGDSKISTWIYRTAINTCITWHRKNRKYSSSSTDRLEDISIEPIDSASGERQDQWRELMSLISCLGVLDKALITLWLDGRTYDEIAEVTGLGQSNVAVRLHRIKSRLNKMANS